MCCEFGSWMSVCLESCSQLGCSQTGREAIDSECEGFTVLEAVTRQRLVETEGVVRSVVHYLEPAL